jgi:hypothetical protein
MRYLIQKQKGKNRRCNVTCLGAFLSFFTYILDRSLLGVNAVAADSDAAER